MLIRTETEAASMAAVSPLPQTAALNLSVKASELPSNHLLFQRHTGKPVQRVHPNDHRLGTSQAIPSAVAQTLVQQVAVQDPMDVASGIGMPGLIVSRKQREFTPEELKDMRYWDRRRKNNDAARRSRQKRRLTDVVLESQVMRLAQENDNLKAELLAMKERIGQIDSGSQAKSATIQQSATQSLTKIAQVKMPLETTTFPYDQKPVAFKTSASQIGPYPVASMTVSYPVTSLHSVDVQPTASYPQRLPLLPKSAWTPAQPQISNPELWNLDSVHNHLKNTLHALTAEKDKLKHANPVLFKDHAEAHPLPDGSCSLGQRVEQPSSKLLTDVLPPSSPPTPRDPSKTKEKPSSPPSPHSAFAPGVELSKLPHKLRGKMKRTLPQTDQAAECPDLDTDGLWKRKMQRLSPSPPAETVIIAAKANEDDFRSARLVQDGYTPPPSSSSSSEGNISPCTPSSLFDFSVKGSDYLPKVSNDLALSEAHERMVQAAHALAALNKGASEGSSSNDTSAGGRPHQIFNEERERYWDKRRRNNQAAKKCRDAKRLLIDYRAARSTYLEQENDQLRRETSMLQHEVAQLKAMVKKRAETQAVERMSSK
ncbi:uncharacterized protein LOC119722469 [Patiria miniata]|uniref:BZIP domain-containing protein n=1 Tax=Patiria miniata TaxID=46514 RepID=A0A913ZC88_PATMI|nr:uncharacterized protein LOC119722469 [Patiria miniata]